MPNFVREALETRGLTLAPGASAGVGAYLARPDYQQNDYLGWISRAKRLETRQKRLSQMLDELEAGGVYMRMKWHPK